jgi:hypothetical protein
MSVAEYNDNYRPLGAARRLSHHADISDTPGSVPIGGAIQLPQSGIADSLSNRLSCKDNSYSQENQSAQRFRCSVVAGIANYPRAPAE